MNEYFGNILNRQIFFSIFTIGNLKRKFSKKEDTPPTSKEKRISFEEYTEHNWKKEC